MRQSGLTPYGASQQIRVRQGAEGVASPDLQEAPIRNARRREYVLWLVALTIAGLIIVSHLLGSGSHGH